jgi:threonyl-tRNA synthetase
VINWRFFAVKAARFNFDWVSGYRIGKMSERKWLVRIVFLETVAGCPGFVGAMIRHLGSLRKMQEDNGWIHTLLEEAENERMHLLTFIKLYRPGYLFRAGVLMTQGVFSNALFIAYLFSPRVVHRFVGYLEEEAVKTYTHCLAEIDAKDGPLAHWKTTPAPDLAKEYWQLGADATMRDVICQVRADEGHHRDVNHTFATIIEKDPRMRNPFEPGH